MHRSLSAIGCMVLSSAVASAQRTPPRTYANPIDIDYRYNFE
jgi:xylan 1,4-beta-xylosidase